MTGPCRVGAARLEGPGRSPNRGAAQLPVVVVLDGGPDGRTCSGRRLRALMARLLYTTAGPVDPHRTAVYYAAACRSVAQVRPRGPDGRVT